VPTDAHRPWSEGQGVIIGIDAVATERDDDEDARTQKGRKSPGGRKSTGARKSLGSHSAPRPPTSKSTRRSGRGAAIESGAAEDSDIDVGDVKPEADEEEDELDEDFMDVMHEATNAIDEVEQTQQG
jgi:hypothetical protein